MAAESTLNLTNALRQIAKTPNIILQLDGFEKLYGIVTIKKFVRWGDVGLEFGNFVYGGLNDVENQGAHISINGGTTTSIRQNLNIDIGKGESIASMQIALIDKNGVLTKEFGVGQTVADVLGTRAKIWLGEEGVAFPEDYIELFKGRVDDITSKAGVIILNVAHADKSKQSKIFPTHQSELTSELLIGESVINVTDASAFLLPVLGPDATIDSDLEFMVRIDDEIIKYEVISGNQFQTISRAQLGTTHADHAVDAQVTVYYRLTGDCLTIALKLMLSGFVGDFASDQQVTHFLKISVTETKTNAVFFNTINIGRDYGLTVGDYISITGALNGANNVSLKKILDIETNEEGSYLIIEGVSFVLEANSNAVMSFRSQFDVYPDQIGLKMVPEDIDVKGYLLLKNQFLSSVFYDFYIKEEVEAKEFITEQLLNPAGAFSIPRAKSSVGYHSPPIPTTTIKDIDLTNVLNPDKIAFRRTTTKSFYNHVAYKYDEQALVEDLKNVTIIRSQDSINRIDVGNTFLTIEAKGYRKATGAETQIDITASRRLKKYRFAADRVENIQVQLKSGHEIEIGDLVLLDLETLKMSDKDTGLRGGDPKLFNVINRVIDYKTGVVALKLEDSGFDGDARFGLQSPASLVKTLTSPNKLIVKPSFSLIHGANEYRKWEDKIDVPVIVRSEDFSVVESNVLKQADNNELVFENNWTIGINENYILEFDIYSTQPAKIKLIYAFMNDGDFAPGEGAYLIL